MSWKHVRREAHRHTCPECRQVRVCRLLGRGHGYSRTRQLACSKCNQAANKIYRVEQAKIACARCGHAKWAHEDFRTTPRCAYCYCECEAYVRKEA